jgi:hypothetical protein
LILKVVGPRFCRIDNIYLSDQMKGPFSGGKMPTGIYSRKKKQTLCHPSRKHYGLGLCIKCWRKQWREKNRGRLNYELSEEQKIRHRETSSNWTLHNRERVNFVRRRYYKKRRLSERKRRKKYSREHPEQSKRWYLKKHYGLSLEEYNEMVRRQGGVCYVCGKRQRGPNGLSLDHNHTTNKPRKLLCRNCNLAIGFSNDSPELLEKLAAYLRVFN